MSLDTAIEVLLAWGGRVGIDVTRAMLDECYEFEDSDLQTAQRSREPDAVCAALTFLWVDIAFSCDKPETLIQWAVVTSGEALARCYDWHDPASNVHHFCDVLFEGCIAMKAKGGAYSEGLELLAEVIVAKCHELQQQGSLDWVALANSCAAAFPETTQRLFAFLSTGSPANECALQYICAVAYRGADHPWLTRSVELWTRYGTDKLPVWSGEARETLARMLAPDAVVRRLRSLPAALRLPKAVGQTVTEIVDEIVGIQLNIDYVRRRRIVLHHLSNAEPAVWDDEYGIDNDV